MYKPSMIFIFLNVKKNSSHYQTFVLYDLMNSSNYFLFTMTNGLRVSMTSTETGIDS